MPGVANILCETGPLTLKLVSLWKELPVPGAPQLPSVLSQEIDTFTSVIIPPDGKSTAVKETLGSVTQ